MLYLTEDQARQWNVFENRIPLNTYKFLNKKIHEEFKEINELQKTLRNEPEDFETVQKINHLNSQITETAQLLTVHHTIVIPPNQNNFCSMGTAILLEINGIQKIVIPDVCVTSAKTICFHNPLCKAILGKEKFDEGSFKHPETNKEINFRILDIFSYSETKRKFFSKQKHRKEEEKGILQIAS